jgi:uncharacterized protein (TIGR03085 family)
VSTPLDARERAQLCARFDELGPDAPTLCEGWSTADLAAHLAVRERNLLAGPGIVAGDKIPALGRVTERAMEREKAKGYDRVVERVRTGPPPGPFAVPGLRTQINLVEYAVHHEDVRRANGMEPRTDVDDLQDALWPLLVRLARFALRGVPAGVGVELRRPGDGPARAVRPGERVVQVTGDPLELLLWAYGRGDHARFEIAAGDGATDADVDAVRQAHLTI